MLLSLHIRDFVIVDEAEISFGQGFTVFSGETGAGKSILIDALALCLGARGDASVLREGASRADIHASFAPTAELNAWLQAHDLDAGEELVLRRVIDARPGHRVVGVSIALCRGRTVIVADTAVHDMPDSSEIADIAEEAASFARRMGYEPRVAMLAYSTFGHPQGERSARVQEAVRILDKRRVDFEYDGEMAADVALNVDLMKQYPFCRLSGAANVLVMPAYHSASISTKMLQELGGSTIIGPLLIGLNKSVQIVPLNAKDSVIVNMAAIAAYNAGA